MVEVLSPLYLRLETVTRIQWPQPSHGEAGIRTWGRDMAGLAAFRLAPALSVSRLLRATSRAVAPRVFKLLGDGGVDIPESAVYCRVDNIHQGLNRHHSDLGPSAITTPLFW